MHVVFVLGLVFLSGVAGCNSPTSFCPRAGPVQPWRVQPVVMAPRRLQPSASPPAGERIELRERDLPFLLYLPAGWREVTNRGRLAIHFHTADWVAVGEHLRAGYRFPLVVVFLGAGSARYREPFLDEARFPRLIQLVEAEERRRGVGKARVRTVDLSSFSAGYGAVRELVQQPTAFALVHRVVLSDSLYGGLVNGPDGPGSRVVRKDQVECWLPFARAALRGERWLVLTCSEIVPPDYAGTGECAAALLAALGLEPQSVPAGSTPAAAESTYPLRWRADAGHLHFWGYAGRDPGAHLVHPRHLADVWMALDVARRPERPLVDPRRETSGAQHAGALPEAHPRDLNLPQVGP